MSSQKNLLKILVVACLFGVGAMLVRRQLIEPDAIGSLCTSEAAPAWCVLRQWLIQGFANNVYGWLSLGAVWLALLVRWRGLAWLALAAGILGCTLYRFDPAGAGVLLAVLVLGRLGVATGQQQDDGEQRA